MKKKHIILIVIAAAILLIIGSALFLVREQYLGIDEPLRINVPPGTDYTALVASLASTASPTTPPSTPSPGCADSPATSNRAATSSLPRPMSSR